MTIRPNPKTERIRLTPAKRTALKKDLYFNRAQRHCETCGRYVPLEGTVFEAAHLSHKKSVGSGGEDSADNTKIECYQCHIVDKHGPRWSKGAPMK